MARSAWCLLALLAIALGPAALAMGAEDYVLGPQDQLEITVLGHEELSRVVTVLDDGKINCPLAGEIAVGGLTIKQATDKLTEGLKVELVNPQVTVVVKTPRPQVVRVGGAVKLPGNYDLRQAGRVVEAITVAGDLSIPVEACRASILRNNQDTIAVDLLKALRLDPEANLPLQAGDVLYIADTRIRVSVSGQVAHPGQYAVPQGSGTREAVAVAGGVTPRAALTRAYIKRGEQNLPVDLFAVLEQGDNKADCVLENGDVLQVPESRAAIAVWGNVNKPGFFEIRETDRVTVVDAIAMAGDTSKTARSDDLRVIRMENGQSQEIKVNLHKVRQGDLTQNIALKPGDIVMVPGRKRTDVGIATSIVYPIYLLQRVFGL